MTNPAQATGPADLAIRCTQACGEWVFILRISCVECIASAVIWVFNHRMNGGEKLYIWQSGDWPNWRYDVSALIGTLTDVSRAQGLLLGRLADVGMALRDQDSLAVLTEEVVKTSVIEGEVLNVDGHAQRPPVSSLGGVQAQH